MRELAVEFDKLKLEHQRIATIRAAYNADKQAFNDRVADLENQLRRKDQDI